jgi:ubiquinone/menaquinone biosynthesis C-methylase UbiE
MSGGNGIPVLPIPGQRKSERRASDRAAFVSAQTFDRKDPWHRGGKAGAGAPAAAIFPKRGAREPSFANTLASAGAGYLMRVAMAASRLLLLLAFVLPAIAAEPSRYETRADHDPNGIGVFYLGREIAHVMGHQAAGWLERPEREEEERTDVLIDALKLKPGDVVADIGAGTGYISQRMAKRVGDTGTVYAEDIQQEMLDLMERKMKLFHISNMKPLLGTTTDPKLPPAGVDMIIMVDVYHEFDQPYEMTEGMLRGLKTGGRLIFVEFRGEDPEIPIKAVHKMTEAQVKKEMSAFPQMAWVETIESLPRQHIIVFRKK